MAKQASAGPPELSPVESRIHRLSHWWGLYLDVLDAKDIIVEVRGEDKSKRRSLDSAYHPTVRDGLARWALREMLETLTELENWLLAVRPGGRDALEIVEKEAGPC